MNKTTTFLSPSHLPAFKRTRGPRDSALDRGRLRQRQHANGGDLVYLTDHAARLIVPYQSDNHVPMARFSAWWAQGWKWMRDQMMPLADQYVLSSPTTPHTHTYIPGTHMAHTCTHTHTFRKRDVWGESPAICNWALICRGVGVGDWHRDPLRRNTTNVSKLRPRCPRPRQSAVQ